MPGPPVSSDAPGDSLGRAALSLRLCWDKRACLGEVIRRAVNGLIIRERAGKYPQFARHDAQENCGARLIEYFKIWTAAWIINRFPRGRSAFRSPEQSASVVCKSPREDASGLRIDCVRI